MMQELFPHFNKDDRYVMLNDIRLAQPAKFQGAFSGILPMLSEEGSPEFTEIFLGSATSEAIQHDLSGSKMDSLILTQ